jgi:three-Cys-motif partner protein
MSRIDIDYRDTINEDCLVCDANKRKESRDDGGLCLRVRSTIDGLPLRCVGGWGRDKVYRLLQYLGIFTQGMKNQYRLHYIELCSGPGRVIDKENRNEFDGTAIALLRHPHAKLLTDATFIDIDDGVLEALKERIDKLGQSSPVTHIVKGDYNSVVSIDDAIRHIPSNDLCLVFVDPTDLSVPFTTLAHLADSLGRADLIINVADGTDFVRNAKKAIEKDGPVRKKYERFLGAPGFFESDEVRKLSTEKDLKLAFLRQLEKGLEGLGYKHFDREPIKHYYGLLFATKHERGLDFWKKAQRISPDGQRSLFA